MAHLPQLTRLDLTRLTHSIRQLLIKTRNGADGFVFVTPQYNWGYPAVLKTALDQLLAGGRASLPSSAATADMAAINAPTSYARWPKR